MSLTTFSNHKRFLRFLGFKVTDLRLLVTFLILNVNLICYLLSSFHFGSYFLYSSSLYRHFSIDSLSMVVSAGAVWCGDIGLMTIWLNNYLLPSFLLSTSVEVESRKCLSPSICQLVRPLLSKLPKDMPSCCIQ